ncbi:hypothetical protein [Reticulibacter mediterranei]|nr:hypothetical protein [Reticulibacter mediterranei]
MGKVEMSMRQSRNRALHEKIDDHTDPSTSWSLQEENGKKLLSFFWITLI